MLKILTIVKNIGIGISVFSACAAGAFVITPSNKGQNEQNSVADDSEPFEDDTSEENNFDKFISKLVQTGIPGLKADIELDISWPQNNIGIDGDLLFRMEGIDNIDLNCDLKVKYNESSLPLNVSYINQTLYASLKDLNIKMPFVEADAFVDELVDILGNSDNQTISSLLSFDIGSLISDTSNFSLDGLNVKEELDGDNCVFSILSDGDLLEGFSLDLYIKTDSDFNLAKIGINKLQYNDLLIFGTVDCDIDQNLQIVSPENEYRKYTTVFSYMPLIRKIVSVFESKKIGIDLTTSLQLDGSLLGSAKGNIFIDISDVSDITTFDKISFDANIELNGNESTPEKYSDIMLNYVNGDGYLNINDVFKGKLDNESINLLINKISQTISSVSQNSDDASSKIDSLFDFITSSELITSIKEGKYDCILKMIKTLKTTDESIEVEISLKELGLGIDSEVLLTITSNDYSSTGDSVVSIDFNNISLGSLKIDLALKTIPYSSTYKEFVINNRETYQSFNFINSFYDQFELLLQTKQIGFNVEGAVLNDLNDGFSFEGSSQFDIGEKAGFGEIDFVEYKNGGVVYDNHNLKIDVTGDESGSMLFAYQNKLKGKFTIKTLNDLIKLVSTLLKTEDPRFTKFLDPIKEMLLSSAIGQIIQNKKYFKLSNSDFIKVFELINNEKTIDVIINGAFIGLNSDIHLNINLNDNNELSSISLIDLSLLGKEISFNIELSEYTVDENTKHILFESDGNYLDFSDIVVLLDFAIKTSQLNSYHLKADVSASLTFIEMDLELDFYIEVKEKRVRVLGYINNIPVILGVNNTKTLALMGKRSAMFLYEPNEDPDQNGYIHIRRETNFVGTSYDERYYWVSESQNFLDNIVTYLLKDIVGLTDSLMDKVETAETTEKGPVDFEDMFVKNGFVYSKDKNEWGIGINLSALTQSDAIRDLYVTISGDDNGYLSSLHAEMKIVIGISINIKADITLCDIDEEQSEWNQEIANKYTAIINSHSKSKLNSQEASVDSKSFTPVF